MWRVMELLGVFVALPIAMFVFRPYMAFYLYGVIMTVAVGCTVTLLRDPTFDRSRFWKMGASRAVIKRSLLVLGIAGPVLIVYAFLYERELFFLFPKTRPGLWIAVLILYPLLSVYPQEVIFRTFFFHRYQHFFPGKWPCVIASAVAFSLAHLYLFSWIALVLTFAGGVLFARTYQSSESTVQASLEHGFWGDFLFTIGLGWYFYVGAISAG